MSVEKWVNAGEDEGALHALLQRLPAVLPVDTMDVLWLFPTRRAGNVESTVIVVAAFAEHAERRRVLTAHFRVTRNHRGQGTVEERVDEHALAPVDALPRVVEGVVRRVGDEVGDAPPREVTLAGNAGAWATLIEELGGSVASEDPAEPPAEAAAEQAGPPDPSMDAAPPPGDGMENPSPG
ncbi:MAG: hypothetical protein WEB88_02975 [Gemmatimonadota bacterium]